MKSSPWSGSMKSRMKWVVVGMGATLLLLPARGAAQSKKASEESKTEVVNAAAATTDSSTSGGPQTKTVRIWDGCDPASFNAAVGPGTCQPGHHGQMLFTDFFAEIELDQIAGAWRFNPLVDTTEGTMKIRRLEMVPGDRISFVNMGGETHTFTRVDEFGGGFFAPLNGISGNPDPAPECAIVNKDGSLAPRPESDTNQFVEAGTTELGPFAGTKTLPLGVSHWECCIHPWMRLNVVVRDRDH
jgi:plastocyanin